MNLMHDEKALAEAMMADARSMRISYAGRDAGATFMPRGTQGPKADKARQKYAPYLALVRDWRTSDQLSADIGQAAKSIGGIMSVLFRMGLVDRRVNGRVIEWKAKGVRG